MQQQEGARVTDYGDVFEVVCFKIMHLLACLAPILTGLLFMDEQAYAQSLEECGRLSMLRGLGLDTYQPFKRLLGALRLPAVAGNHRIAKLCVKAIYRIIKQYTLPVINRNQEQFDSEVMILREEEFEVLLGVAQAHKADIGHHIENVLYLLCYD